MYSIAVLTLTSRALFRVGLQLGKIEMLRGFRKFLSEERPQYHSAGRQKESGAEKGSDLRSSRPVLATLSSPSNAS